MAKKDENPVLKAAKRYLKPRSKLKGADLAKEKARLDILKHSVDELVTHSDPQFLEDALDNGYKGSGIERPGKNGKTRWVEVGLNEAFDHHYTSHAAAIHDGEYGGSDDSAAEGIEKFVFSAIGAMKDHTEAHAEVDVHKKRGFENVDDRVESVKEIAASYLGLDPGEVDSLYKLLKNAKDKKSRRAYTTALSKIVKGGGKTPSLGHRTVQARQGHLLSEIRSQKDHGRYVASDLTHRLYKQAAKMGDDIQLGPETESQLETIAAIINSNDVKESVDMIQKLASELYGAQAHEGYRKSKKKKK